MPEEKKTFYMDTDLFNQFEQAKVDARKHKVDFFPKTLKDFLNEAAQEKLARDLPRIQAAIKAAAAPAPAKRPKK